VDAHASVAFTFKVSGLLADPPTGCSINGDACS
jgi:hypothetical protein